LQKKPATEAQLQAFWKEHPNANVGLAYGPGSGLNGIDVEGESGEAVLREKSNGDLPDTLEFFTGKGRRLLYRIPSGLVLRTTTTKPKKGEELRLQAEGAMTVMPPSRHPNGLMYRWRPGHGPDEIEPAMMPGWMVKELTPPTERNGQHADFSAKNGDVSQEILRRATAYLEGCPPAISGQGGHNTTMGVARAIVYGFDLGPEIGYGLLENIYNPRCQPPWSEAELRHKCKRCR
jgi:hypothetical protein